MGKKKHIEPIATTYRGRSFRSRLEARWAVFLDYHHLVDVWEYEPRTFQHPSKGWSYTPDFVVKVGPFRFMAEIKPEQPTPEYLAVLLHFVPVIGQKLVVCWGDFFQGNIPLLCDLSEYRVDPTQPIDFEDLAAFVKDTATPINQTVWFPDPTESLQAASSFRFDLPQSAPPNRKGSYQNMTEFTNRWVNRERQRNTKRKRKRKR